MVMPAWLESFIAARESRLEAGFLGDALWGQYCLFMFIRLQDRIFDGHSGARPLMYIADQYLVESERQFASHFSGEDDFWEMYRSRLRETTLAILHTARLHRQEGARSAVILEAARNVNA